MKHVATLVAPGDHVVQRAGILHPRLTGHPDPHRSRKGPTKSISQV
jgi:hypothetical protein